MRSNQNISALFEDDRHILWIGTDEGSFNTIRQPTYLRSWTLKPIKGDHHHMDSTILKDEKGNIWICAPSQGVFRYDEKKLTAIPISLTELIPITSASAQWDIYAVSWYTGLLKYDAHNQHFVQIKEDARDARC